MNEGHLTEHILEMELNLDPEALLKILGLHEVVLLLC